jgi:hypothetical protein
MSRLPLLIQIRRLTVQQILIVSIILFVPSYMGPIYPVLSHDSTTGEVILDAITQYIRKYVGLVLQMVETLFMKL